MALTPEQIEQGRQMLRDRGYTPPQQGPSAWDQVFQRAEQIKQQKFDAEVENAPGILGAAQGIAKDAFGTLIAKPAYRLSQGIATGIGTAIGGETGNRIIESANAPANVPTPFGKIRVEGQKAFGEGGARQIAGDTAKSASYLAPVGRAGGLAGKTLEGIGAGKVLQATGAGAAAGALGGGLGGLGEGLQDQNAGVGEVAMDTAMGAGIGAVAGGALGATGAGIKKGVDAIRQAGTPEAKLKYITPTSTEIPTEEFKNLVNQGRIAPKTLTKPAQYILSPNEKEIAIKYSHAIDKEPVKTAINLGNEIGKLDEQVGQFLEKNNGIYNRGELRNHLDDALADLDDISIPEERIQKLKTNLVQKFVDSVEKNDMKGLWKARKEYDQAIDSAFKGSPTLQKDVKIKLRNAVQDFIADHTPEGEYQAYMHDMSNLFDLRDVVDVKAAKGRGLDELRQWAKDNPRTAKVLGWLGVGIGLGALGTAGLGQVVQAGGND